MSASSERVRGRLAEGCSVRAGETTEVPELPTERDLADGRGGGFRVEQFIVDAVEANLLKKAHRAHAGMALER